MLVEVSTRNTLRYDSSLCIGCGLCSVVCPHGVFVMDERVAALERPEDCMECGACSMNCPSGAIAVDSGVGCAAAMIKAALTGREVSCGGDSGCCAEEVSCCAQDGGASTSGGNGSCCGG